MPDDPQNLYVVNLEVMDDGRMTHGYTSLHRTPEGAATRLYGTAADWQVDLENDPDVSGTVSFLPIED